MNKIPQPRDRFLPILDMEALLEPIGPDNPVGKNLEYDAGYLAVVQAAEDIPPHRMGDAVTGGRKADWPFVKENAQALFSRAKDMRLALLLCQALIRTDGYRGFSGGLRLFGELLARYWDTAYPRVGPGDDDPTERVNILASLTDTESILLPLRRLPIVSSPTMGDFSMRDMDIAKGVISPPPDQQGPDTASINAAFMEADPEELEATSIALSNALTATEEIDRLVTGKIGPHQAPDLSELASTLDKARRIIDEHLAERGYDASSAEENPREGVGPSPGGSAPSPTHSGSGAGGRINGTEDVIIALDRIIDYYRNNEPSSPVPLLMERAKTWVHSGFMEILEDIAPNGVDQARVVTGYRDSED
uniref:Type VI secretion system protein ImpA n=1 Tax=Candidatus Kentrum sp. DK TaxID=2126562 RepID=A0A450T7V3_9GAMM|nr:MAG: type VI secretion system protein ImpA [Candidatus Kentron sp. DK]